MYLSDLFTSFQICTVCTEGPLFADVVEWWSDEEVIG